MLKNGSFLCSNTALPFVQILVILLSSLHTTFFSLKNSLQKLVLNYRPCISLKYCLSSFKYRPSLCSKLCSKPAPFCSNMAAGPLLVLAPISAFPPIPREYNTTVPQRHYTQTAYLSKQMSVAMAVVVALVGAYTG